VYLRCIAIDDLHHHSEADHAGEHNSLPAFDVVLPAMRKASSVCNANSGNVQSIMPDAS
jgi:hypothetical protein